MTIHRSREWAPLAVGFFRHLRVAPVSKDAKLIAVNALTHIREQRTDGHISAGMLKIISAEVGAKPAAHRELLETGLWEPDGDGWRMPSWHDWNPPESEMDDRRRRDADRKRDWRQRRDENATRRATRDTSVARRGTDASRDASVTREEVEEDSTTGGRVGYRGHPQADPPPVDNQPSEDTLDEAVALVASRRPDLDGRPERYLRAARRGIRDDLTALIDDGKAPPDADARTLADRLHPPPKANPTEGTAAAARAAQTRDRSCPHCSGSGWTVHDDGVARPCRRCTTDLAVVEGGAA